MAKSLEPSLIIEGVYSATPREMTEPRISYKVSIPEELVNDHGIFQKRMHIVLCFEKKQSDCEHLGWHVGGWMKECIGSALVEQPILGGRLRRCEDGCLEIVSNDSGVRCVEAQMPLSLVEFLQSKDKNEVMDELVYWKDVDEANPQFSPLFYVQVTNFQCGVYSIGISCSILLADPLLMGNFLHKWADIHNSMAYEGEFPKIPYFYTRNHKRIELFPPATKTTSNSSRQTSKTMIFTVSTDDQLNSGDENCKHLMLLCIEKAESKFGTKMSSNFTLITKEPNGDVKVEKFSKKGILGSSKSMRCELNPINWEDLRTNEVTFRRANMPIHASHWIACNALEGVVMTVISSLSEAKSGMDVYVTLPCDEIKP